MSQSKRLRIGYVPEHFSTPLHFAAQHFNLDADLIPEPLGTGALATRLKTASTSDFAIDVAVGLTEGFVADLGKTQAAGDSAAYGIVGTYVESPLCWAISTGAQRDDVSSVQDLKGGKVGVSRIGSGSYVMSYVLADQHGWLQQGQDPFGVEVIGDFAALRQSVRREGDKPATDFFMWEHFTTKHYWDNGELKRIGEIYTPWPSWMIVARNSVHSGDGDGRVNEMLRKINEGVKYYREHAEEAVEFITSTMRYSAEDAREWMNTVKFAEEVRGVKTQTVEETISVLKKAGVLGAKAEAGGMIA
ncbi:hypothetical protein BAUCODRAFT_74706 [Baudoinia panamericana UAMH 10762]|uniref:Ca3427-like PBP 2 domain-containing protein n=1 Tax=Baudoinia panamericana (strain UAMH 10762) TaxID=717646 RepID=M2MQQ8_BAUPA|nr:uncharacterized protein BAUCODRAFT_74706 [Baudoinia panamericana UAMH 10762]EMC93823.1 hypothetical protein BAUCODRAFT_74706 [Baudoinia panamericana UAMH 10762]